MKRRADDAAWRLGLLADRGIYISDGSAHTWCGPGRPGIALLAEKASQTRAASGKLRRRINGLAGLRVTSIQRLAEATPDLAVLERSVAALDQAATDLCLRARNADARTAARLLAASGWQDTKHPLAPLNESRHDRLGWLPLNELADSNLARWAVTVNPPDGPRTAAVLATPLSPCVVLTPVGVVALWWGAIGPEERYLQGKFGADYDDYRARVRRWL